MQGQQPRVYDTMSKAQRALIGSIEATIKTVQEAEEALQVKAELPPLGDDAVIFDGIFDALENYI